MSRPEATSRPRLAVGCRLSEAPGQDATLLLPEGALRLNGPGLKIVQCCDGRHTVNEIVGQLQAEFRALELGRIEEETAVFLERLHEKRAVDFE